MSLVTTASRYWSRIRLQSTSTSVVLPEPTGPPTPTRNGDAADVMKSPRGLRTEQARIQGFVARRSKCEADRGRTELVVAQARRDLHRAHDRPLQREQHRLARLLAERNRLHRRQY